MLGSAIGDIIGSPYEFERGPKRKNFGDLFIDRSHFTDDTVMTVAIAEALMEAGRDAEIPEIKTAVIEHMRRWGANYLYSGFGSMFVEWLVSPDPQPYGSWGNGSAMRVAAAGWLYNTLDRTREVARATAEVTHNHPEGIKGAEATATAIYLSREGYTKKEIRRWITQDFGYDLAFSLNSIRPEYKFEASCQKTVPQAIVAFLEATGFEDAVRNAVSIGGDCDTLTCITASIAEAYYQVPKKIRYKAESRLPIEMLDVLWAVPMEYTPKPSRRKLSDISEAFRAVGNKIMPIMCGEITEGETITHG